MIRKIFNSIFLVTGISLLFSSFLIVATLYAYFSNEEFNRLENIAYLLSNNTDIKNYSYQEISHSNKYRITIIDLDGSVLFDTNKNHDEMENHSNRKEFKDSLKYGFGKSERISDTLSEKTFYYAKKLDNDHVLRVSTTQKSLLFLIFNISRAILFIIFISIFFSLFLANNISKKLVEPLNKLDLENPLDNNVYEELSPLLRKIDHQKKEIENQLHLINKKHNEFLSVIMNINEAMILIDTNKDIISINKSGNKLFHTTHNSIGTNILSITRDIELINIINSAINGEVSNIDINISEKKYQVNSSPIIYENKILGACILFLDITEKFNAQNMRKEFSANVSHELKTPLHSIMASAELLENNLVKPEDNKRFIGHIRKEAQRLLKLIDDIIFISKLDENIYVKPENININKLTLDIIELLKNEAKEKNINTNLTSNNIIVNCPKNLLYEIIFNLYENSIKYNKENGLINISIKEDNDLIIFNISDTGIGISENDIGRVFERFYRVDKSHSKNTGGTGLGLSIVKHCVESLKGNINISSELNKGTSISISFPKTNS